MKYKNAIHDLDMLFDLKNRQPYLFRTRLERTLVRLEEQAKKQNDIEMLEFCYEIMTKLNCISDKSNQTPEGTLKSFLLLEEDLIKLRQRVEM